MQFAKLQSGHKFLILILCPLLVTFACMAIALAYVEQAASIEGFISAGHGANEDQIKLQQRQSELGKYARKVLVVGVFIDISLLLAFLIYIDRRVKQARTLGERASASSLVFRDLLSILPMPPSETVDVKDAHERAMLENVTDVVCSLDANGKFIRVSPASKYCWGYAPDELSGRWLINLLVQDDIASTTKSLREIADLKSSIPFECRMQRKDGLVIDTLWSAYWSEPENCMFCISHEITERKKAERLLVASENRVRAIVDNMPVAIIVFDGNGAIEVMNPAAEQMFGYAFEERSSKSLDTLFDSDTNRDGTYEKLLQSIGKIVSLDGRKKTGQTFPLEISINHFDSPAGERFILVGVDVTERRELEKLKQEFVGVVSHELRTPLTSVQGFLSMLVEQAYGETSELMQSRATNASQQITRLMGLINNLLDSQKMEAGRFDCFFSECSLSSVANEAVGAVTEYASRQKIVIKVDLDGDNFDVEADEQRIVQVLINLLSNALKFSPAESAVTVSVVSQDATVEIRVQDNGPGIPTDATTKIFEKYQQVVDAAGVHRRGTGLGLPICKSIIEQHGGSIGVVSQIGKGSCFWFRIPRVQAS